MAEPKKQASYSPVSPRPPKSFPLQSLRNSVHGLKASMVQMRTYISDVERDLEGLETGSKRPASIDYSTPVSKVSKTEPFFSGEAPAFLKTHYHINKFYKF